MNDIDPEEYNNIIQEIDAAEEEGESALSLFLHDLIEIDIESNFSFSYTVIERVFNICVKSLKNHLVLLSNECLYFIRYCVNKCGNIKEADENFFKNISTIISICLSERNYTDDAFLLFERNFFLFVQDINSVPNFIDVWNGHVDYLNEFIQSLLQITAFHLCLLNETISYLRNNTSTSKHKKKKAAEEIKISINRSDYNSTCQNTSLEGNTSVGVSSYINTENLTKSEVSETSVSFIQKGYSRLKIIEIASCLILYFFDNSVEIENIESFEECVNIILKEYENIPDIEIKKKIICLFKSISAYAAEKELSELPFNKSIISLIKRKRNYYLTLTKEKDISINYLKENSYVYINNTLLSIQTVNEFIEGDSENTRSIETIVLTPTGFKGSLLINIFYIYFYNTRNELLMVLSYDRINLKQDEEKSKIITLQFFRNDATGILSNKLKEKFEEYFHDIIEISITFQSVETKKKIYDILSSIVKIENAKANVEDIIGEDESDEEVERESDESYQGEIDIKLTKERNKRKRDKKEEENETFSDEETIELEERGEKGKEKEKDTARELRKEDEHPKEIIQEKLQRRKVSFATTKEIRLMNENDSIASKTVPLEESVNNYSYSVSEYLYYENESLPNDTSVSVKASVQENMMHDEIRSVTSSSFQEKLVNNKYYKSAKEDGVDYSLHKYERKRDFETKKYDDQYSTIENNEGEVKGNDVSIKDTPARTMDSLSYTIDNDKALIYLPFERKCFSEKDGDDYKKINDHNAKRAIIIDIHDKYTYKELHPNKLYKENAKVRNEDATDLQPNRIGKRNNKIFTEHCDASEKKDTIVQTLATCASSKEENVEIGEGNSISAIEIVNKLLDLNSKQQNINNCIKGLHNKEDTMENKEKAFHKLSGVKEKGTEDPMTSTEQDGKRRSKRVQAQKNIYSSEMLYMIENAQSAGNEKIEKSDETNLEKRNVEANEKTNTHTLQNVSELVSIVGTDESSNEPIFRNEKGDRENKEKNTKENCVHRNETARDSEKKEDTTSATVVSSIDRRSIVSSINKKRVLTSLAKDAVDCYSKSNIDSPYPLKKIKQSNYDSTFLDSLKNDEDLESLSVKYLMKAYTLIQYSRRYVHIQIVDYFRKVKRDIVTTHEEINKKYNTLLREIQNEYEKKFENLIEKYSTRLISKKKKLNTDVPEVLDIQIIQHKIKSLEETLKIIQNTVKNKIENSNILLKYKECELYTPTFSLATLLSKNSN